MTTHVLLITDMSGSMAGLADDVRGGFNSYIADLRADTDVDYRLSVTLFDTEFIELCKAAPLADVPALDETNYRPRGMTALLDAVGMTVNGFDRGQLGDDDRVLVVVQTDGHENSSREYRRDQIADLIKSREAGGKWSFIFLGAGPDTWQQAAGMGFARDATVSVAADSKSTAGTYSGLSGATRSYSRGGTRADVSGLVATAAGGFVADEEDGN